MRYSPILALLAAGSAFAVACSDAPTTATVADVAAPAAIKYGALDNGANPAVVLIVMDVEGAPAYRCSGTLLDATHVLTAGHCTGEPGEFSGMRVFTEADVQHGNNNYPNAGPNTIAAVSWSSHPQFTEAQFYLHDVGVIKLASAVPLPSAAYGTLPAVNQLDALKPSAHTDFTAVGYGLQFVNPAKEIAEKVRMVATPHLVQINTGFTGPGSLLLSNNASTGGTCFGDSGGPNFLGSSHVVAGVTSFGINGTCGGTGGVFRLDRADVLAYIQSAIAP